MPAIRKWREYTTGIVHGFDGSRTNSANWPLRMFCGAKMFLRSHWANGGYVYITVAPSGKRLTQELPSVKTQITCVGCLAES